MIVKELIQLFDSVAPFSVQESYDNSGLQVGLLQNPVNGVLLTIDVTEEVVDEAVQNDINTIVSHHPVLFVPLKRLSDNTEAERILRKAVVNNLNIISVHTNLDLIYGGVSFKMAEKLELQDAKVLKPVSGQLKKLVVFVPQAHAEVVRTAIFEVGAGTIGEYDYCSFNASGKGTFRAGSNANPFVGVRGQVHEENEVRIETIFPAFLQSQILTAMHKVHPYEEVAYDLYSLDNTYQRMGFGVVGTLRKALNGTRFLNLLKERFNLQQVRYTGSLDREISKVALCGGSGSFLIKEAKASGADIFISADIKYHQFFDLGKSMMIADIGHFESECFTTEIFSEIIRKKIPNFVVRFSEIKTNPINYY